MRTELEQALSESGFCYPSTAVDKLVMYYELLTSWNKHTNLTALTEPRDFIYKHVIDSLHPTRYLNPTSSLVDVGTGAGFPGLPLKLVLPDLQLTLVEAGIKKVTFLAECSSRLDIDAEIIHGRAEELGRGSLRETFSHATTRAVAAMAVVSEYCLPLLQVGGFLLALKGPGGDDEVSAAKNAIQILGGVVQDVEHYKLPTGDQRSLVVIEKVASTPDKYPRRPGVPAKKPL